MANVSKVVRTLTLGAIVCFMWFNGFAQVSTKTVVVGALLHNYEGLEAGAAGNLREAKHKFTLALQFEPHYPPTLLNLRILNDAESGEIPLRQGVLLYKALNQFTTRDSSQAINLASRAIEANPEYGTAYLVRALTYEKLGHLEPAQADYNHAIKVAHDLALSYYFRGKFYSSREEYRQSVADFTSSVRLDRNLVPAFMERGIAHVYLGDNNAAVKDFGIALKAWPRWETNFKVFGAYLNRGIDRIQQQHFPQALSDLNRAIQLNPKFPEAYLNRGIAYVHLKSYSKAIADFDYVLEKQPDSAEAYFQRGICFQNKGNFDRAVENYLQTISLNADHVQTHFRLGEIYSRQRRLDLAVDEFDRVLALAPGTYWAHYRKAVVCDKAKDWSTAIDAYNAFFEGAPDKHSSHKAFARERARKLVRWTRK